MTMMQSNYSLRWNSKMLTLRKSETLSCACYVYIQRGMQYILLSYMIALCTLIVSLFLNSYSYCEILGRYNIGDRMISLCMVYGWNRLDERKRRKDFILERNLLYPNPFEKDLSPEERELCRRYDVFMRFHSKEDHEDLLQTVISEHRTLKRIQDLKV